MKLLKNLLKENTISIHVGSLSTMSIENKSNYFFPLPFHSVQCGVIISTYTKNILNQCLRYKFGNCWGNSYIPKIDIPLWSAFNFCEPPGPWPAISACWAADCSTGQEPEPTGVAAAHAPGWREHPGCCAFSRNVLPTGTHSMGSPEGCDL